MKTDVEIQHAPSQRSQLIAFFIALMASLIALVEFPYGMIFASIGLAGFGLGLVFGARVLLTAGTGSLYLGVLLGATTVNSVIIPLISAAAVIVAWDIGDQGISIGNQLSTNASASRLEFIHGLVSIGIGLFSTIGAYIVYRVATGNQPVTALFLLLFAAIVLIATLRD
ncbi:MAG: hypothetical protein ABEI06_01770 [Halobacteriaceae archaeon]